MSVLMRQTLSYLHIITAWKEFCFFLSFNEHPVLGHLIVWTVLWVIGLVFFFFFFQSIRKNTFHKNESLICTNCNQSLILDNWPLHSLYLVKNGVEKLHWRYKFCSDFWLSPDERVLFLRVLTEILSSWWLPFNIKHFLGLLTAQKNCQVFEQPLEGSAVLHRRNNISMGCFFSSI